MDYYNDNEAFACQWLYELMYDHLLPKGVIDDRDIREIRPADLAGYRRCHFFAGIGGWSYALELAGWPGYRPVWTGSCPCQPFSTAGKRKGETDERHLWPAWMALIRECRPDCIFGEQVGGSAGYRWLDGVRTDLEAEGYAFGAADLPAAGVGAPHIRQRLFWCANVVATTNPSGPARKRNSGKISGTQAKVCGSRKLNGNMPDRLEHGVATGLLCDTNGQRQQGNERRARSREKSVSPGTGFWSDFDILDYRDGKSRRVEPGTPPLAHGVPGRLGRLRGYGNAIVPQVAATFIRAFLDTEGK